LAALLLVSAFNKFNCACRNSKLSIGKENKC
jgi:hypothetical protein